MKTNYKIIQIQYVYSSFIMFPKPEYTKPNQMQSKTHQNEPRITYIESNQQTGTYLLCNVDRSNVIGVI